jgi:hypothetical protein
MVQNILEWLEPIDLIHPKSIAKSPWYSLRAFLVSRVQQGVLGFGRSRCEKKKEEKTTFLSK